MTAARPRNKKALSRETSVALIKETTTRLFIERGYHNCHVEAIAAESGFTKGAVYHYFSSKDAILEAILGDIEESIFTATEEAANLPDATASQRLVAFLNAQARYAVSSSAQFTLLIFCSLNFALSEGALGDKVRAIFNRLQNTIETLLGAGIDNGEFAAELDREGFARVIVGCYSGNVVEWQRSGFQPEVGRALVKGVREMILNTVFRV